VRTNDFRTLSLRPDNKVYPSITPETREGLYDCVEHIGPAGIRGRLLDCAACDTHPKVDASLDGQVLGSGYADRPWPNLSEIMGRPISCESAAGSLSQEVQQEPPPPKLDDEVKAIAFYLPHYHPIPENDAWLGKGFTEWTHVTRATPQFAGHSQPQLPGELGFYDLRNDDVRERQARLAREHGIHGFCYSYSWFNGRRVLERPLENMLEAGTPDFPFCICWANENWTGRWDGLDQEVLLEQTYDETSDLAFIEDVLPILRDPRYIRFKGAPLLLVSRVDLLPDPVHTCAVWRQACREAGLEAIHLCAVETADTSDPYAFGFDSAVQFPPHRLQARRAGDTVKDLSPQFTGRIYDYEWTVADEINAPQARYRRFRGVMTSWDNTARRGSASHIFVNATPEAYEVWLRGVVDATRRDLPAGERLLFINAWNDWAEGAHLEPDQKFGRAYLEATRRALRGTSNWQTLVEYATSREEMSGAVLANWISDVAALLKGHELSWRHLVGLQRERLGTGHADTIVFSKVDSPPRRRPFCNKAGTAIWNASMTRRNRLTSRLTGNTALPGRLVVHRGRAPRTSHTGCVDHGKRGDPRTLRSDPAGQEQTR
jgi:hypothetical protein